MPSLRTAIHSKNFPKPTGAGIVNLKMKDGGQVSPWSLKGMGQSLVNAASSVVASPAEKRANASLRTPAPATAAPAPTPAPAPAQIAAPMGSQSVIDRRMAAAGLRNGGELHLLEGGPQDIGVDPATAGKIAADAKAQHMGIMARTSSTLGQMNTIAGATPDSAATPAAPMSTSMPSLRGGGLPMAQPMTASGDAWAFGQLQNGGTVPGSGEGDKVPAMYEPGEFVVSNDMLDAAPSLRGELQGLRAHVLAKKGMTPAEADAKAVHFASNQGEANDGPTLRQGGKGDGQIPGGATQGRASENSAMERDVVASAGRISGAGGVHGMGRVAEQPTTGRDLEPSLRVTQHLHDGGTAVPGMSATTRPMTSIERLNFGIPNENLAVDPATGKYARGPAPTAPITSPPPQPSKLQSWADKLTAKANAIEAGGNARAAAINGVGERVTNVGNAASKAINAAGEAASAPVRAAGNVMNATGNAAKSVGGALLNNPLTKTAAGALGAYQTYNEYDEYKDALGNGDTLGAMNHGLRTVGNAAALLPGPAGVPGKVFAGGLAVADGAMNLANRTEIGRRGIDAAMGGVNRVAQAAGGGVDSTAKDLIDKYGGFDKIPQAEMDSYNKHIQQRDNGLRGPQAAPAAVTPAAATAHTPVDWEKENAISSAYNAQNNAKNAPAEPTSTGIKVEMQPNGTMSFSGSGGSGPVTYVGPGGKAVAGGSFGGGVTSMPASAFVGTSPSSDANLSALRMDAAKRGDWGAVNASLAAQGQAPVRGTDTGGGGSPRDMIMDRLRGAGKLSVAGLKLAQDLTNSDNQLRGHQMAYNSSMTGHDTAREGHQLTSANNKARLQYDINKDHRDYTTGRSDKAFEHQQKGAEAFEKNLTSLYPGEDGKGDQKQIAVHRQMATNYVNDLVQTLTKAGDHQAAAELAQAGPGALHTNHQAEIAMAMRTRAALEKANGWMPTTGGFKDSTHPNAWKPIGYEKRPVGGDHVLFPKGHISVNDMRGTSFYNQTGGTSDFDQLIADAQKAEAERKGAK